MQRRIYGRSTDLEILPLNKERAVEAAADILGELFLFSVAGFALVYEVQRSSEVEARKEEIRKQEMEGMKKKNDDLAKEVELLKHKLEDLAKEKSFPRIFKFWNARACDVQKSDRSTLVP